MEFDRLIQQPESLRDEAWELAFLQAFPKLNVEVSEEQAQRGPDGWPYLKVKTGGEGKEPALEIIRWLATRGIGLAVNAHKMMPDYVFTYGMIWNFAETGVFVNPAPPRASGMVNYSDKNLLIGPPSDKYLPPYVRAILRQFLSAQGFAAPKILVISSADYSEVDLVFSIESLNNLKESDHKTMAEMLSWFLPLHYSLVLLSKKELPPFTAL